MHSWLEESLALTTSLTLLRTLFRREVVFKHAFDRYNHHCQLLKCEGNGFWYIHVYTVQMYTCVYVCLPSPMLPLGTSSIPSSGLLCNWNRRRIFPAACSSDCWTGVLRGVAAMLSTVGDGVKIYFSQLL